MRRLALVFCLLPVLCSPIVSFAESNPASGGLPDTATQPVGPRTVIQPEKLAPLFPKAPEGWSAAKPNFVTQDSDQGKTAVAMVQYANDAAGSSETVDIWITDFGKDHPYLAESLAGFQKASEPSDEGYQKPITIQGFPGQEDVDFVAKLHHTYVIVANRFYVDFVFTLVAPEKMPDWTKLVDLKKLAEIK